jgi:hypothetical protein
VAVLGNSTSFPHLLYGGMSSAEIVKPWLVAFESDDPSRGGCPDVATSSSASTPVRTAGVPLYSIGNAKQTTQQQDRPQLPQPPSHTQDPQPQQDSHRQNAPQQEPPQQPAQQAYDFTHFESTVLPLFLSAFKVGPGVGSYGGTPHAAVGTPFGARVAIKALDITNQLNASDQERDEWKAFLDSFQDGDGLWANYSRDGVDCADPNCHGCNCTKQFDKYYLATVRALPEPPSCFSEYRGIYVLYGAFLRAHRVLKSQKWRFLAWAVGARGRLSPPGPAAGAERVAV